MRWLWLMFDSLTHSHLSRLAKRASDLKRPGFSAKSYLAPNPYHPTFDRHYYYVSLSNKMRWTKVRSRLDSLFLPSLINYCKRKFRCERHHTIVEESIASFSCTHFSLYRRRHCSPLTEHQRYSSGPTEQQKPEPIFKPQVAHL
jgi:hypothetical protein